MKNLHHTNIPRDLKVLRNPEYGGLLEDGSQIVDIYFPTAKSIKRGMLLRMKDKNDTSTTIIEEVDEVNERVLVLCDITRTRQEKIWYDTDEIKQVWQAGSYEDTMKSLSEFDRAMMDLAEKQVEFLSK